ncbi:hypothetical protein ORV05_32760 [Amycolatopsis cynarae]|uniref:DUF4229 domain-containing protein n=1 Tax=Amycolatopsis cynarae TaxID=2995223 RepID=A0ABY7B077_9PSEU|nr:hypothetical protein [Amycolatopsis sp. HUAS 11-8]WAL65601.1 hypothetical protein ORV05_32760 [Amycolatopsis sp. HUAS 11-8]
MSIFEVLARYGTLALLRFAAALLLFLALHLIRIPLVLAAAVLAVALGRLDRYATRQASTSPRRPVNDFYPHTNTVGEEAFRVHA